MRNLIYSKLDSPFPNYKIKRPQKLLLSWKLAFAKFNFPFERHHIFNIGPTALQHCRHLLENIFMLVFAFWLVPHVMVQEVSSKPPTQWCSLICLLQHFSGKWTICSPDMAIFVCKMLKKSTFGGMKDFHSKFKKYIYQTGHRPVTSTDDKCIRRP